jgi:hypothetical protein
MTAHSAVERRLVGRCLPHVDAALLAGNPSAGTAFASSTKHSAGAMVSIRSPAHACPPRGDQRRHARRSAVHPHPMRGPSRGPAIVDPLRQLLPQVRGTLLSIWDSAPTHRCRAVKDFVATARPSDST